VGYFLLFKGPLGLLLSMAKKKTEQNDQEQMNQLAYELRLREEQVKSLNDNLRLLSLQVDELGKTIDTINHIKNLAAGEEMLIPLGPGVFMKAKVADVSTLTMELGARILAERKPDAVAKILEEQKKQTEEARNSVEQQLNSVVQRAQVVQKDLEELLKEIRSGASSFVPKV